MWLVQNQGILEVGSLSVYGHNKAVNYCIFEFTVRVWFGQEEFRHQVQCWGSRAMTGIFYYVDGHSFKLNGRYWPLDPHPGVALGQQGTYIFFFKRLIYSLLRA